MKIYVYQYELPFSRQHYNVAQHYVVGQSESTVNKENPTITVLQDELIEATIDGQPSLDINSHKLIHINRIVPKAVAGLVPKYAQNLDEKSTTRSFDVVTVQHCPDKPEAFRLVIHTNTFPTKQEQLDPGVFYELQELPADAHVEIANLDFHKELDKMQESGAIRHQDYSLDGEKCYCIKLVRISTSLFGKGMIESGVGNKMRGVYYNNFKNVIGCYDDWKDLRAENIRDIRQGKGVKKGEEYVEE